MMKSSRLEKDKEKKRKTAKNIKNIFRLKKEIDETTV